MIGEKEKISNGLKALWILEEKVKLQRGYLRRLRKNILKYHGKIWRE